VFLFKPAAKRFFDETGNRREECDKNIKGSRICITWDGGEMFSVVEWEEKFDPSPLGKFFNIYMCIFSNRRNSCGIFAGIVRSAVLNIISVKKPNEIGRYVSIKRERLFLNSRLLIASDNSGRVAHVRGSVGAFFPFLFPRYVSNPFTRISY